MAAAGPEEILQIIEALNDAFRRDPEAMDALISARVECNKSLADHPSIQVGRIGTRRADHIEADVWEVGTLGIVNGVLGAAGFSLVAAMFDDETGQLRGFTQYTGATEQTG